MPLPPLCLPFHAPLVRGPIRTILCLLHQAPKLPLFSAFLHPSPQAAFWRLCQQAPLQSNGCKHATPSLLPVCRRCSLVPPLAARGTPYIVSCTQNCKPAGSGRTGHGACIVRLKGHGGRNGESGDRAVVWWYSSGCRRQQALGGLDTHQLLLGGVLRLSQLSRPPLRRGDSPSTSRAYCGDANGGCMPAASTGGPGMRTGTGHLGHPTAKPAALTRFQFNHP